MSGDEWVPMTEGGAPPRDHDPEGHEDGEEPRRKRRAPTKLPGDEIAALNLTPMMDVMTILLVFLVMSFAQDPGNINVNLDKLKPPDSSAKVELEAATRLTITSEEILVDDKSIVMLKDINLQNGSMDLPAVREALIARADHLKTLESMGGEPFDGRILVIAHNSTPYGLLTAVLYTAGQAKFGEYKLVVMQKPGSSDGG